MKKVKQRNQYECVYKGEEIIGQILQRKSIYDLEQNLILMEEFLESGELLLREKYTYENGKIIEFKQLGFTDNSSQITSYKYKDDKIFKEIKYFNETDFIETTYKYNLEGKLSSIITKDNEEIPHGKFTYEYKNGYTIEKEYNEENEVETIKETLKDEYEQEIDIRITHLYDVGNLEIRELKTYQAKEELLEVKIYENEKLISEVKYIYDDDNELVKIEAKDYIENVNYETRLFYNEKLEIVREEMYENENLVQIREFQYDEYEETIEESYYDKVNKDFFEATSYRYELEYYE